MSKFAIIVISLCVIGGNIVPKGIRSGDFSKVRELVGMRAAVAIPRYSYIRLDHLEKAPPGYEDAMKGSLPEHRLSWYTRNVIDKQRNAATSTR